MAAANHNGENKNNLILSRDLEIFQDNILDKNTPLICPIKAWFEEIKINLHSVSGTAEATVELGLSLKDEVQSLQKIKKNCN